MYLTKWKHQVFGETIGDTYLTLEILHKDKLKFFKNLDLMSSFILLFCFYKVYDGKDSSSRSLGSFTKNDMMGVILNSTSNHLWIEFNTNGSDTDQGFQLTYTSK